MWGPGLFLPTSSFPYPHLLDSVRTLVSHPTPWRPGLGQSLGPAPGQSMCSPRGWIRAGVTHLESGAPLHLLSWLPSPSQEQGAWDSHSPPLHWDVLWMLVLPTPRAASRDCLTGLWGCSRLPLFPQPCTQGSPWVMKAEALGQPCHSKGSWGCAQPWIPGLPQLLPRLQSSGKGGLGHRRGGSSRSLAQASLWSCATLGWHLLRVHV